MIETYSANTSSLFKALVMHVSSACCLPPAVFCIYYITRGVLQENRQELVAFVLSVLVVMIRSVVNFSVLGTKGQQELLVRSLEGIVNISCAKSK